MKLKKFFRPWVITVLIFALAAGGCGIYYYVKSKKSTITYKTATVTKGTLTATVSGTGNIIVNKSANVAPSISGEVKTVLVKAGDIVKRGQALFTITNDDLDISVSKAYASLLQAKQSLSDAEYQLSSAQSNQTTINNDSRSTDDQKIQAAQKVSSSSVAIEVAKVNVQSAQSSYTLAKKTASERTVITPIAGTVTSVNVSGGDTIGNSSGQSSNSGQSSSTSSSSSQSQNSSSSFSSASVVINDLTSLTASVLLNEVDASSVKAGQAVSMTFDAIDDLTLTGKVLEVGATGTESSGVVTYPVTILFDSLDNRLKPQMSVTAVITTNIKQDVLMVANSAIKTSGTESYVLLMKDGIPTKQTVTIGIANDSYTEIASGLSENDTVVTQTITSSSKTSNSSSTNSKNTTSNSLKNLTGSGSGAPSGGPNGFGM